jgi:hypothetical protein
MVAHRNQTRTPGRTLAMPSELREALTAATASAFVPRIIDPLLLEYQRRYSPVVRAVPSVRWDSDAYYFNSRTAQASGGFVQDGGARASSTSQYSQSSFQMKHLQVVGGVTGYAQQVTRMVVGDLRAREIQGSIRGLYWDVETALLWANAGSTASGAYPQFDGLDTLVSTYSGAGQNCINYQSGGITGLAAPLSLSVLDELIDMAEGNFAGSIFDNTWMLVMSNTAATKIAQLQTAQQRYTDVPTANVGLIVPTYRGIPIVKSSFLQARGFSMGTVTSAAGTGALPGGLSSLTGSLGNATYKYVVTPVIARQGEIQPCAEVSQATGGTSGYIQLLFTPPTGLEGSQPILYKVYRTASGGASGTETLLGYVDAVVGLASDGVTAVYATSIYDTGAALIPVVGTSGAATTVPGTLLTAYYGTNTGYVPPVGWNGSGSAAANQPLESMYLISRDPDNVLRPYVREMEPLDVYPTTSSPDSLPFALIDDTVLAVRAPKYLARASNFTTRI